MKDRFWFFMSMFLVAFQVLIALPIAVWLHNQFNFSAAFSDSTTVFGVLLIALSGLLLLLALITPRKIQIHLFPAFVFISILVYLQQYLLIWDYGILDGQSIDFSKNNQLGLIDTGLWLAGVVIFIALRKKISNHAKTILSFSCLLTAIAVLTTLMSHDFTDEESTGSVNEANKFTFSKDKNIFLFLLDGFQSDLFWEMIDKYPDLKADLTGFTFYPNTSGVFAKTYPTIPLLLTGKMYQKERPFQEFLTDAYQDSILSELKNDNWNVGLYPYVKGTIKLGDSFMSNYLPETTWPEKIDNYLQALDLSLFQSVPHAFKHRIYNNGDFITQDSFASFLHRLDDLFPTEEAFSLPRPQPHQGLNFQDNLREFGAVDSSVPAFRFYHLFMPHEPFLLDRNLKFGRIGEDFSDYQEYAFASIQLMITYLRELKRLGVYDSSSIIIAADHGGGEYTHNKYISSQGHYVPALRNGEAMASGKPLLMIKSHSDSTPFGISSKPVSLLDVAPTIAGFAGIDPDDIDGQIIDEIEEDQQRERLYYHYRFSGWDSKFLNDFEVFSINGHVYDEDAWTRTGRLTAQEELINKEKYLLGSTIKFGTDTKTDADYMNAFLVGDDYEYQDSQVLADDGRIVFSIPLDVPVENLDFLLLETDVSSTGGETTVTLELDQQPAGSFYAGQNHGRFQLLDVRNLKQKDRLDLRFYTSDQVASTDRLIISTLKLQQTSVSELGNDSEISFSENLDDYFITGMGKEEPWGRWTSEKQSSLHFYTSRGFCENSYLLVDINRFYAGVDPDSFEVFLNGRKLEPVETNDGKGKNTRYFDCSSYDKSRTGIASLVFKTDKVLSPLTTGTGRDTRNLGVALKSLKFVDKATLNSH